MKSAVQLRLNKGMLGFRRDQGVSRHRGFSLCKAATPTPQSKSESLGPGPYVLSLFLKPAFQTPKLPGNFRPSKPEPSSEPQPSGTCFMHGPLVNSDIKFTTMIGNPRKKPSEIAQTSMLRQDSHLEKTVDAVPVPSRPWRSKPQNPNSKALVNLLRNLLRLLWNPYRSVPLGSMAIWRFRVKGSMYLYCC